VTQSKLIRTFLMGCFALAALAATGCQKKPAAAAGAGPQGLPVQTKTVAMDAGGAEQRIRGHHQIARSAMMQPQVSGSLTAIRVRSGDHVKKGQPLIDIDPRQQQATVASLRATERQKKALSTTTRSSWVASRSCSMPA
jgi:multidrug efflux pump subunit AcrA (membrane-fusion protein)